MQKHKEKLLSIFFGLMCFGLNIIYWFCKLLPTQDKVAIVSRQSDTPSVDIELLAKELAKQAPSMKIVVATKKIQAGWMGKIKYGFYMIAVQMPLFATSKVVVLDGYCLCASLCRHKSSLIMMQMWHALGTFKNFGYSAIGKKEGYSQAIADGMRMHKNYDVVFVSSEAMKNVMAIPFHAQTKQMVVLPLPRVDLLKDESYRMKQRERFQAKYPKAKEKKVLLFVPTFRKTIDIVPFLEAFIQAIDFKHYLFVVKTHPLTKEINHSDHVLYDQHFTSLELLCVADVVVTDYSAIYFEAALANKPIYRYIPDEEDYRMQRGLNDLFLEAPGFISKKAKDVMDAIDANQADLEEQCQFIRRYIAPYENNTERMAKYILDRVRENEK